MRRYVPFMGGLALFLVALWASNASISFKPEEARADDPTCTQGTDGACVEVFNAGGIDHQYSGGVEDAVTTFSVVYHPPTVVQGEIHLSLYVNNEEIDEWAGVETQDFWQAQFSGPLYPLVGHNYNGYSGEIILFDYYDDVYHFVDNVTFNLPHPAFECSDTVDNDEDLAVDYVEPSSGPAGDPHCIDPNDDSESVTVQCSNGIDDDEDSYIDDGSDEGCTSWEDTTETDPPTPTPSSEPQVCECNDGIDNDWDDRTDNGDAECDSVYDDSETYDGVQQC